MPSPLIDPSWVGLSFDALCPGRHTLIGASRVLVERQTAYQHLVIAEVPALGLGLFLDGNVQLIAEGEPAYHERIALLPALAHPRPAEVLILGGGDGCAAREALRDPRVARVTLVELDPEVVEACATYLAPLNGGSLADPRVVVRTLDARRFLREADLARFDVVVVDFLDAYSADDLALYDEVLGALAAGLTPEALVSLHGDLANPPYWSALRLRAIAARHFPAVAMHSAYVPCYQSEWAFLLAGRAAGLAAQLTGELLAARAEALERPPQTVIPELFPAALRLAPALAALAAQVAADPYRLPEDHRPGARWVVVATSDG